MQTCIAICELLPLFLAFSYSNNFRRAAYTFTGIGGLVKINSARTGPAGNSLRDNQRA
jgi:hypothetical protein